MDFLDREKLKARTFSLVVGVAIVLAPVWLTELFFPSVQSLAPNRLAQEQKRKVRPSSGSELQLRDFEGLDRDLFLVSFERQAGESLVPCLRSVEGPTGSISVLARINRNGRLSAVRVVHPASLKKVDCVVDSLEKMTFASAGSGLVGSSLELNWAFSW